MISSPLQIVELSKHIEIDALREVILAAIAGPPSSYAARQRKAWASRVPDVGALAERLTNQRVLVARRDQKIVAFMSWTEEGLIDFAFTSPSQQRTGLFSMLLCELERLARDAGIPMLTSKASLDAVKPFERHGFARTEKETVVIADCKLERYHVEKQLSDSNTAQEL